MKDKKIEYALLKYSKGEITLWKAATMSGLSMWEMMDIIAERKIPMSYGLRDLEEDLKGLRD